jgi:MFS family permease
MSAASFILKRTNITTGKQLLFYTTAMVWVMSYTLLAFSVSLILSEKLSVFWIGLFMSLTDFISIFADVPIGFFQKIFSQRTLLLLSVLALIITTAIFIGGQSMIFVTFIAVLIYGLARDLYDITMLTYIFQNAHPESYSQDISQRNVAEALGLLGGLAITTLLNFTRVLFDPLWFTVLAFVVTGIFIALFFNKTQYDISVTDLDTKMFTNALTAQEVMANMKDFWVSKKKIQIDNIGEAQKALQDKMDQGNVIALKPIQKQQFEQESFSKELKESIQGVFSIVSPPKAPLIWSSLVIGFFSFWDTFVVTFQPIYIAKDVVAVAKMNPAYTYIIISVLVIPLFLCQVPFSKLADKFGRPLFMFIGIAMTAASVYGFTISNDVMWTILMGLINSMGYAAAFPVGQAFFAQRFQENYAIIHNTQTMDTNVSAGPLKMILNFGNVFGSLVGGALIAALGFKTGFLFIAGFLVVMFLVSLLAVFAVTKPITKETSQPLVAAQAV